MKSADSDIFRALLLDRFLIFFRNSRSALAGLSANNVTLFILYKCLNNFQCEPFLSIAM